MQAAWDTGCMDVKSDAKLDVGPVFRGLAEAGIAGKEIAGMLGVAPSTISKWRRGSLLPSEDAVQFMTLVLADRIGVRERTLDAMADAPLAWRLGRESEMSAMRQALRQQEAINQSLPASAVRQGSLLFKAWLERHLPIPSARRRVRAA